MKSRPTSSKLVNSARRRLHHAFKKEKNAVSIFDLFRYSSRNQKILVLLGVAAAILNGLPLPVMLLVYGKTTDKFVTTSFCAVIDQYNISEFCPPNVNEANINQEYYKCNWTGTNVSIPDLTGSVSDSSLYFIAIGVVSWISIWIQTTLLASACERIVCNVRIKLFQSILSKPISWFDCHDSGTVNNYFSETVNKYKQGIGDKLGIITQTLATLVVCVIISLSSNWKLSLVLFALSPLFIVISAYATMTTTSATVSEQKYYAQAGSIAQQSFANIRTVHAFNGLGVVQEKYERHLDDAKRKGIINGLMAAAVLCALWIVLYTSTAVAFWFSGRLVDEGISVGVIIIVFYSMQSAVFNLGTNLPHYNALVAARSAAYVLYETLGSTKESLQDNVEKAGLALRTTGGVEESSGLLNSQPYTLGAIKFDNVIFSYPSRPDVRVLDGVSLEIPKGKTVALIGESGSGKSTIAQLLLKFYNADSGNIIIGDHLIDSIDVKYLRSQVGCVSQEPVLFSTTIAENIRLGKPDATDEELRAACRAANALEFIEAFPLQFETEVGESGSQLSGGQKQRIAIARALISNPPYLILDEATSALDSQSEKYVQEALDAASRGRTTIIIAHRLSTIRNADVIIGMARGKVVETGTHDELMATESMYKRLVHAQMKHDLAVVDEGDEYNDIDMPSKSPRRRHLTSAASMMSEPGEEGGVDSKSSLKSAKAMWYLFQMNRPEIAFIIIGCLTCISYGAMQIVYELFFAKMVITFSHCDSARRRQLINRQSLDFLWIGLITGLSIGLSTCCFAFSGEKLTKRVRKRVFETLIRQETGFFDRAENSPGTLSTLLSSEAAAVQGATGIRVGTTLSALSILIVGLVVSFAFGWQLSLVILAFVPILIAGGAISTQVSAGFDAGDKKFLEAAGRIIVESTSNIRLVKQLRQERYFSEKYEENVNFVCKRNLRRTIVTGFLFGFSFGSAFFGIAVTYYAAAKFIEQGLMTSEDLMIVLGTLFFGAMAVGQSQAMAPDFGKALSASKKVYKIIHTRPEIDASSDAGIKPEKFYGHFVFEGVSFAYPTRRGGRILKNISLKLSPKESVALVGMSGCGKSTIIHLLQRFYDPSRGRIVLDGVDIKQLNLAWYRGNLGIVTQEPVLFDWSIAENIAFGDTSREVTMEEIQQAAKAANIDSFIRQLPLGYWTPVGSRGSLISGGQKQRICIARAIVRNPAVLLLDEATSALDPESEKAVQEAINEAQKNRASVAVAHRLATIQNCDNIFVLDGGRVVEEGRHGNLLRANGLYADLYQLSMR